MTESAIVLGATAEPSSPVARGIAAYMRHVNARGGVRGRAISYLVADDGGDPALALEATRRLVEDDGVFAIAGSVGTEQSLTVREYLNSAGVPQLFAATGATALGRDHRRFPWTIGFRPSYRAEGWIYGSYLARTRPAAKVGVLASDDADARELLAGLREGIARSRVRVVAVERLDAVAPDVEAQTATLAASGADTLAVFVPRRDASAAYAAVARLGRKPQIVVAADATVGGRSPDGAVSIAWAKDPADPRWRDDAALRPYRAILGGRSAGDAQGMAAAYELVRLLKAAGPTPTRAAVLARLRRWRSAANPFLLPGIVVATGATDRFPVEQAQLRRAAGGRWRSFGGLWRHPAR